MDKKFRIKYYLYQKINKKNEVIIFLMTNEILSKTLLFRCKNNATVYRLKCLQCYWDKQIDYLIF